MYADALLRTYEGVPMIMLHIIYLAEKRREAFPNTKEYKAEEQKRLRDESDRRWKELTEESEIIIGDRRNAIDRMHNILRKGHYKELDMLPV